MSLLKRPSAYLPILMSLSAFGLVMTLLAVNGGPALHQADEGAAAHLWQLLVAGQLPIVGFFALKWLPRTPREALPVLALQAVAGLLALAPVFLLRL